MGYLLDRIEGFVWALEIYLLWFGLFIVKSLGLYRFPLGRWYLSFGQKECDACIQRMETLKNK